MHKRMDETGEPDLTSAKGVQELASIGSIPVKRPNGFRPGREIRVAVKVAGTGEPAIDLRQYVVPADDVRAKGYDGPDRKGGLWLTVVDAERLLELLGSAIVAAETEIERRNAATEKLRALTDDIGRGDRA